MKVGSTRAVVGTQDILADCWISVAFHGYLSFCPHAAVYVEYSAAGFYMGLGKKKELGEGVAEAVWGYPEAFYFS